MPTGLVLSAVNRPAAELGLARGRRLADVLSAVPDLETRHTDPKAERVQMDAAAAWARQWSPWTRADGTRGLVLDVTGCAHLFGGERAMLRSMVEAFARLGFIARPALAPTLGAAHALARHAAEPIAVLPEHLASAVEHLPVDALRLAGATVLLLRRLGLKTVGQLQAIPRASLTRRFNAQPDRDATWEELDVPELVSPLKRLDQMLGHVPEPVCGEIDRPPLRVLRRLTEPVGEVETVLALLDGLLARLVRLLEKLGLGLRRVEIDLYRVDGTVATFAVPSSRATRDTRHFLRIAAEKLANVDAGFGFDVVSVWARDTSPFGDEQVSIEAAHDIDVEGAFASLVDRIAARVGAPAVLVIVPNGSHWPERSELLVPAPDALARPRKSPQAIGDASVPLPRPERLIEPPEPIEVIHALPEGPPRLFRWRRLRVPVLRHEGPERIAPEWWREKGTARARDYYRVEDGQGRRFWLFRHGLHDDERGATITWFLHGLFA